MYLFVCFYSVFLIFTSLLRRYISLSNSLGVMCPVGETHLRLLLTDFSHSSNAIYSTRLLFIKRSCYFLTLIISDKT